ncbi:MAG: hypothetical protein DRO96_00245 [Candidatus Aenigmatarchaeota archaeon]|nr:MAG: hypothetical protein DRN08_02385 [Thermoplasmata archaeon]RLI97565.1 MAG: hypothetical protein DRO96_00245 [Candidatus Aenigmarchaeota archaeon]
MLKLLSLISGGIDSPVAAYLIQKSSKETHLDFIFFFTGADKTIVKKCIKQIKKQLNIKRKIKLFIVPYKQVISSLVGMKKRRFQCILCKRAMLRMSSIIARKYGYDALITGDSLGQVASQTLENLFVEDRAGEIPVLRPLIGYDKMDIVRVAADIGTLQFSQKHLGCQFAPKKPKTTSSLEEVEKIEKELDISRLIRGALGGVEVEEI